jgi:hypothetical protein
VRPGRRATTAQRRTPPAACSDSGRLRGPCAVATSAGPGSGPGCAVARCPRRTRCRLRPRPVPLLGASCGGTGRPRRGPLPRLVRGSRAGSVGPTVERAAPVARRRPWPTPRCPPGVRQVTLGGGSTPPSHGVSASRTGVAPRCSTWRGTGGWGSGDQRQLGDFAARHRRPSWRVLHAHLRRTPRPHRRFLTARRPDSRRWPARIRPGRGFMISSRSCGSMWPSSTERAPLQPRVPDRGRRCGRTRRATVTVCTGCTRQPSPIPSRLASRSGRASSACPRPPNRLVADATPCATAKTSGADSSTQVAPSCRTFAARSSVKVVPAAMAPGSDLGRGLHAIPKARRAGSPTYRTAASHRPVRLKRWFQTVV